MADFEMLMSENKAPEQPTPEQPTPEQPTPEQPTPEQPTPEQPTPEEKINITDLFDAELIADLFNKTIDFVIVSGLMLIAKNKGVEINRNELELPEKEKTENKELITKVVEKIKIPTKLIGTILFTLAILSKYVDSYKIIDSKKKLTQNFDNNEIKRTEENRATPEPTKTNGATPEPTKKQGRGRPRKKPIKKNTINV